jgi:hypothetical protein
MFVILSSVTEPKTPSLPPLFSSDWKRSPAQVSSDWNFRQPAARCSARTKQQKERVSTPVKKGSEWGIDTVGACSLLSALLLFRGKHVNDTG